MAALLARTTLRRAGAASGARLLHATTTRASSDVVVIGASVIDLVAYCPHMPAVGETVLGSDFQS